METIAKISENKNVEVNELEALMLLFDRPGEPIFTPKGDNCALINVPNEYMPKDLSNYYDAIKEVNQGEISDATMVDVLKVQLPDISYPMQLPRMEAFSLFIPSHKYMAAALIDVFLHARDERELMAWAVYARSYINPLMFNYALSVALLHRPGTKHMPLPNFVESFPDKYVDSQTLDKARDEVNLAVKGTDVPIIRIPRNNTAADNNIEHRIAYFREDIGVNLHHWHWHLVYPNYVTDRAIVAKDRRGELFYYMHHQIIARYNFERLANDMNRVKRLSNFREPIVEGYFSKLDSAVAGRGWPSRQDNTPMSDVIREVDNLRVDIADLERWRDRLLEAITAGFIINKEGKRVELDEYDGIDILGNLMECSTLSQNKALYGDLHTMGHILLAYIHDPQHLHGESFSVMGDFATAMRDPVFYRWHAYLDDIFYKFKGTLPRYGKKRLTFKGINMDTFNVVTSGEGSKNVLQTYWEEHDVNLSRGMDFVPRRPVFARFQHIQHEAYTYNFEVTNETSEQKSGTCRIFMGPMYDEKGQKFLFRELCQLMIELDKFVVVLKPGKNTIQRKSSDSSVTIPFERTYRNLDVGRGEAGSTKEAKFNFCGCGWPHNLLIPRGKADGMPVYIFAMISDQMIDRVEQDVSGECQDAASFCGLRDRRYPDTQSMGYPFDRMPENTINYIRDFLTPNMKVLETKIKYTDVLKRAAPRSEKEVECKP